MFEKLFLVKRFNSIDFSVNKYTIYHSDNVSEDDLGAAAVISDDGSSLRFFVGFDSAEEEELSLSNSVEKHSVSRLEIVDTTGVVYSTWDASNVTISFSTSSNGAPNISVQFLTERTSVMSRNDLIAELGYEEPDDAVREPTMIHDIVDMLCSDNRQQYASH